MIVLSDKELKKLKKAIKEKAKKKYDDMLYEQRQTAYAEGKVHGRREVESIYGAALWGFVAREPGQVSAKVTVSRSLTRAIAASHYGGLGTEDVNIVLQVREAQP